MKNVEKRSGLTLSELLIIIIILTILMLVLTPLVKREHLASRRVSMFSKGRAVMFSIIAANAERSSIGLSSVWPTDMNTTATTSTAYFRWLMSSDHCSGKVQTPQLVPNVEPGFLCGGGISPSTSRSNFSISNNAWNVVNVSSNTEPNTAFLITRNAVIRQRTNGNPVLVWCDIEPNVGNSIVVIATCSGSCFARAFVNGTTGDALIEDGLVMEAVGNSTNRSPTKVFPP